MLFLINPTEMEAMVKTTCKITAILNLLLHNNNKTIIDEEEQ